MLDRQKRQRDWKLETDCWHDLVRCQRGTAGIRLSVLLRCLLIRFGCCVHTRLAVIPLSCPSLSTIGCNWSVLGSSRSWCIMERLSRCKERGLPAPSAHHDSIRLLAPGSFDDRLRRVPSNLDLDGRHPDLSCSLLGLHENLVQDGTSAAPRSLSARHLIARKVSPHV